MKDPYVVLGVDKNATDDDIKKAYRELARKYHPDKYADNPLSDLAAEKIKEINTAYDEIMKMRKQGSYTNGANTGGYTSQSSEFSDVRNLLTQGKVDQAQVILDGVPVSKRNAEWYYLSGMVQYRRGYFDSAYSSFATACRMDPQNPEYAEAFRRINRQSSGGFRTGNPYRGRTNMGGNDACDCCGQLICADCCCEMMGGDLISCC